MRRALVIHPASACPVVERIEVEAVRSRAGELVLRFVLTGDTSGLRIPEAMPPTREDELWRRTCFEAFITAPPAEGYCELNFSPSTQWATYGFDRYRHGMRRLEGVGPPRIDIRAEPRRYELQATVDMAEAPLPADGHWRLGLSAVIEDTDGGLSYWALSHPSPKPDFHNAAGFVYDLPAESS